MLPQQFHRPVEVDAVVREIFVWIVAVKMQRGFPAILWDRRDEAAESTKVLVEPHSPVIRYARHPVLMKRLDLSYERFESVLEPGDLHIPCIAQRPAVRFL